MIWDVFTFAYVILIKLGAPSIIVLSNLYLGFRLKHIWSKREEFRRNLKAAVVVAGVTFS